MQDKDILVVLKNGLSLKLTQARLNNYELIEKLSEVDENPLVAPKILTLLLGDKQKKALIESLRDEDGFVPTNKVIEALEEIFLGAKETKN